MGLPALKSAESIYLALLVVTLVCGWCAVSYAICVGVFAHTQEQANGFGAVSIVILACYWRVDGAELCHAGIGFKTASQFFAYALVP